MLALIFARVAGEDERSLERIGMEGDVGQMEAGLYKLETAMQRLYAMLEAYLKESSGCPPVSSV
jgi:hypothetical protein